MAPAAQMVATVLAAVDPGTALWIEVLIIVAVFAGAVLIRPKERP